MQNDPYSRVTKPKPAIENFTIVVVALASFGALSALLLVVLGFDVFSRQIEEQKGLESKQELVKENTAPATQTITQEGYAFELPVAYELVSKQQNDDGDVVVRYAGEENCHFIFALLEDPSWDRFSSPPGDYANAVIPEIQGLDRKLDAELVAERLGVGGMAASLFQFYERETFRGIEFTYLLVAMNRGKKIVLKFGGKYKRYKEDVEFVEMPDHWRRYLMTLRPDFSKEVGG